jgi:hypothetical protein
MTYLWKACVTAICSLSRCVSRVYAVTHVQQSLAANVDLQHLSAVAACFERAESCFAQRNECCALGQHVLATRALTCSIRSWQSAFC